MSRFSTSDSRHRSAQLGQWWAVALIALALLLPALLGPLHAN